MPDWFLWGTPRSSPTPPMTRVDLRQLAHGEKVREFDSTVIAVWSNSNVTGDWLQG